MGRRPIGAVAMTDAERKRRQRHVLHPSAPKPSQDALIRDLQADLDAMDRRLANRDAHIRVLEARPVAPPPKPGKAPKEAKAPSEWSEDPRTKGLQTAIKGLRRELRDMKGWYADEIRKAEEKHKNIPSATLAKVMMCLHSDQRPRYLEPADAERFEAACIAMNAWADSRKRK